MGLCTLASSLCVDDVVVGVGLSVAIFGELLFAGLFGRVSSCVVVTVFRAFWGTAHLSFCLMHVRVSVGGVVVRSLW